MLKKINIMGAELGFGVEYFLSSNFSIGGEYSFRYLRGGIKQVQEYESDGRPAKETMSTFISGVPTFAKFSLNFYFGTN